MSSLEEIYIDEPKLEEAFLEEQDEDPNKAESGEPQQEDVAEGVGEEEEDVVKDEEREVLEQQAIKDINLGKNSDVIDMNRDIYKLDQIRRIIVSLIVGLHSHQY